MLDYLESLGLGPVLFRLGVIVAMLKSLFADLWEAIKVVAQVLMEELYDSADRSGWSPAFPGP